MMYRGPYIVVYSYTKTQRHAQFLNFILVKNYTYLQSIIRILNNVLTGIDISHASYVDSLLARTGCSKMFTTIKLRNSAASWLLL